MPFYLWTGNYTQEAMKALVKKPSDREAAAGSVANAETTRLMTMADFTKAMKKAGAASAKYTPPQG